MDTEQYFNKTEEQQFEEAKSWFKQNGSAILLAMLVGASAVFGWNFWKTITNKFRKKVQQHMTM